MNRYKIDERVGCIAVVKSTFSENCLYPEMDGVMAFWSGSRVDGYWTVLDWQRQKAVELCEALNKDETK